MWRVVYLDGKGGRPFKPCKVCQETERNSIEPVAVFLKENESLTDEKINEFNTCIFHCEKENEVWIENFKEYEEWKERRERALKEGKEFEEPFKIRWNETLVKEFWKRIR
ncbi:hypothetical protein, partial [Thermovibrio sp.]